MGSIFLLIYRPRNVTNPSKSSSVVAFGCKGWKSHIIRGFTQPEFCNAWVINSVHVWQMQNNWRISYHGMTKEAELWLYAEAAWVKQMATASNSSPDKHWEHPGGTVAHVMIERGKFSHTHTYSQTRRALNAYCVKRIAIICISQKEVSCSIASIEPRQDEWLRWRRVNPATVWIAPFPNPGQFTSLTHHGDAYVLPLSGYLAESQGWRRLLVFDGERFGRSTHIHIYNYAHAGPGAPSYRVHDATRHISGNTLTDRQTTHRNLQR